MKKSVFQIPLIVAFLGCIPSVWATGVYVGTYTVASKTNPQPGQGIYYFSISDQGLVSSPRLAVTATAQTANPSYLAVNDNMLYAVSENDPGFVSAYAMNADDHTLGLISTQATGLSNPVYVTTNEEQNTLMVADFGNGNTNTGGVTVFGLNADRDINGAATQQIPYPSTDQSVGRAHGLAVKVINGKEYVLATDWGNNQINVYTLDDATHTLTTCGQFVAKPGQAQPRHLTFSPSGAYVYVANETDQAFSNDSSVSIFQFSPTCTAPLKFLGSVAADDRDLPYNYPSEVAVSKNGKYLYVANRFVSNDDGHREGDIAQFGIEEGGQKLTLLNTFPVGAVGSGSFPREMTITPDGQYLISANQQGNTVTVFTLDPLTGALMNPQTVAIPSPVALAVTE